jgi:SNF2 family DNA or RNA helicase
MTALEAMPCEARLCITATPIQNNLSDMYTIINFVCPGVLGDLATFRKEYERPIAACSNRSCTAQQKHRGAEASRILDEITKTLMLRRLQKDVLKKYLPPRHVFLLFCRPTKQQCKLYQQISSQQNRTNHSKGVSPEALTALMGLRKTCTHPFLLKHIDEDARPGTDNNQMDTGIECSGKLMVLDALLHEIRKTEPTDKVVIVSNFTSTLAIIEDIILKPAKMTYLRLDGSITSNNRQQLVDTFNRTSADANFALTLSSKAGGVGLNLIGSNRLIMVDPDW